MTGCVNKINNMKKEHKEYLKGKLLGTKKYFKQIGDSESLNILGEEGAESESELYGKYKYSKKKNKKVHHEWVVDSLIK